MRKIILYIGIILAASLPAFSKAANDCVEINRITDQGTYAVVEWTLKDKASCNASDVYGFAFSTTSPYQWYNAAGSLTDGSMSLHKNWYGNLTYPATAWSKEAGGACNASLTNFSLYVDRNKYWNHIYYLSATSTDHTWAGGFNTGDHVYLNIYGSGSDCNFDNYKNPEIIDVEAYDVEIANSITADYPDGNTFANMINGIDLEYTVTATQEVDIFLSFSEQGNENYGDWFKIRSISATTSAELTHKLYPKETGTFNYQLVMRNAENVSLAYSDTHTFIISSIPEYAPFSATTSPDSLVFPVGMTVPEDYGFEYRPCLTGVENIFDSSNLMNCAYNLMASTTAFMFIPEPQSLSFLAESVNNLSNTFPFNLFFRFEQTAELYLANEQTAEELVIPAQGIAPRVEIFTADTLSGFFGQDVVDTYFNFMENFIWLCAGLVMFYIIL